MIDRLEDKPDAELLKLAIAGEESAFLLLYERLKKPIFRYAFYMTNSMTAAEEVTQEVFMLLLKAGHRYKPKEGELAGFVFGIARNLVRRHRKREQVYQQLPSGEGSEQDYLRQDGSEELSAQLIRSQGVDQIRRAIASLPEHYRQTIVLCDLCELTYAEAAERLKCAVGTVRSRLNRGHLLLVQKLKPGKKSQTELPSTGTEECLI